MDIQTVGKALDLSTKWCKENFLNFNTVPPQDEPLLIFAISNLNISALKDILNQCFNVLREWERYFHHDIAMTTRCLNIYNTYNPTISDHSNSKVFNLQRPLIHVSNVSTEEMEVTQFLNEFASNSIIDIENVAFDQEYLDRFNPVLIARNYPKSSIFENNILENEIEIEEKVLEPSISTSNNDTSNGIEEKKKKKKKKRKSHKH